MSNDKKTIPAFSFFLIILVVIAAAVVCILREEKKTEFKPIQKQKVIYVQGDTLNGRQLVVYEADGCEYLGNVGNFPSDIIAHKGNCKYCRQRDSLLILSILQTLSKK